MTARQREANIAAEGQPVDPYTGQDAATLDLGCALLTDDGSIIDLNAYYEASEAERGTRALELVS